MDNITSFRRLPVSVFSDSVRFVPISVSALETDYKHEPAPKSHSCLDVKRIPSRMFADYNFPSVADLSKYTEAFGIPIVARANVINDALVRACYVTAFMFSDRSYSRNE